MHFSSALLAALTAASALAAPALESDLSKRADPNWTIVGLKRVCNSADTACSWSFSINTHLSAATACSFTVTGNPASRTNGNGATCGPYTITTGWSGQFGAGNGFTTLAVVNKGAKRIAWPAYTDKQLAGGNVVSPDQSYPVTVLG